MLAKPGLEFKADFSAYDHCTVAPGTEKPLYVCFWLDVITNSTLSNIGELTELLEDLQVERE